MIDTFLIAATDKPAPEQTFTAGWPYLLFLMLASAGFLADLLH